MCCWVSLVMPPSEFAIIMCNKIGIYYCENTIIINLRGNYFFCRKSASRTHVSTLLHALVAITPTWFPDPSSVGEDQEETEIFPVTSYACQWKPPRKRKESYTKISEAKFEKHVYGTLKKRELLNLEEVDSRPPEYRGTANAELGTFLDKVRGRVLCVSMLFDS